VVVWTTTLSPRPSAERSAVEFEGRSGIVCLEIDEATQRRAVIEAKLNGYRRLFDAHPTWWLLFVVPSQNRARWLRTIARGADETVAARAWVTSLVALQTSHLDAPVRPIAENSSATLHALVASTPIGRAVVPVGSEGWLRLLGEGGIEDLDHVLS
jgi:hypothetical protein